MNFLKKLGKFCLALSQKAETKRLYMDLELRKAKIRENNYNSLMTDKLIPYVVDLECANSGLLLTEREANERAHAMFIMGKMTGIIDELNRDVRRVY